jgi:hypothetical protein
LFLFCLDNFQEFLVQQVNPQTCQDKSLLKHRETRGSWAQGVLLHWYEGWDRFTYVKPKCTLQIRLKKNSKRSTTLEVQTSSFYWTQQSGNVSPTPSTWQGPVILWGLHWLHVGGILLYAMSHLLISTIWEVISYQHLSHDSWLLCFLSPHLVPINIYLCSLVIFVGSFIY